MDGTATATPTPVQKARIDGRLQRSRRSRLAILAATRGLMREGNLRPPVEAIAARAEYSVRTVWQHFPSMLELRREALDVATADAVLVRLLGPTAELLSEDEGKAILAAILTGRVEG